MRRKRARVTQVAVATAAVAVVSAAARRIGGAWAVDTVETRTRLAVKMMLTMATTSSTLKVIHRGGGGAAGHQGVRDEAGDLSVLF